MASAGQVTEAHYRRQQALASRASRRLARLWRQVDRDNILPSWRRQIAEAFAVLSSAQAIAAASSGTYVDDSLGAQGHTVDAAGRITPAGFAGVASDGRSLATLLEQPALRALGTLGAGGSTARAMTAGLVELDMITRTQVADAGRAADGVAITARPQVAGYTRVLVGKSCSRCVVLAGRWYRWNAGFSRHPRCDCRHVPTMADMSDDVRTGPHAYFNSLSAAEQDKTFGKAGAEAIRDGAEVTKVVNARRGMQTAGVGGRNVLFTTEGTTSARRVRLMPEQVYVEAHGDRTEAIRLLKLHGYLL